MNARVHVFVSGKVQGVFFRSSTKNTAEELGITGWVRNLPDGRVEAVFEGEKDSIDKMIEWCSKGPAYSQVADVEVMPEEYSGEFKGFMVRR